MNYVADTHALLWYLYDPARLGRAARSAFEAVDAGTAQVAVPAVVVAEMVMVAERRRIPGLDTPRMLNQIAQMRLSTNYVLLPLLPDTVIISAALTAIPDIFDRLVAAEAHTLQVPLITRDPLIIASGYVATLWDAANVRPGQPTPP